MSRKMTALLFAVAVLMTNLPMGHALEVGQKAPDFSLPDIHGKTVSLSQFPGKYVVLEWTNFRCPFVKKHYGSGNMQNYQNVWTQKGVVWISICSSAKGKEGYLSADEWIKEAAEKKSKATAILLDRAGTVGQKYQAKTTPHMFVIDPQGTLIYEGAMDTFSSFDDDLTKLPNYVSQALTEAMAGKKVSTPQTQSYGCSVKY